MRQVVTIGARGSGRQIYRFDRCPKAMLRHEMRREAELVQLVVDCSSRGLLPVAGGMLDQPALYLAARDEIEEMHQEEASIGK